MMNEKRLSSLEKKASSVPNYTSWSSNTVKDLIQYIRELEDRLEKTEEEKISIQELLSAMDTMEQDSQYEDRKFENLWWDLVEHLKDRADD